MEDHEQVWTVGSLKLEETLNRVGNTAGRLKELLAQEREWRERLENHPPLRVLPPDIERQRTEFSVMEQQYIDLQPAVSETLRQASMFAADHSLPLSPLKNCVPLYPDDLAQLHSSLSSTNEEVGQLVRNWSDRLRTRQSTANKFDQDYNGLMSWLKAKDEELLRAEAVAGVPDRVTAQITEVEELQRVVGGRRSDLTAVGAVSDSLCQEVVPEDSLALGDKMAGLKAAYEALERNIVARRRVLEDGLKQAREFVEQWEAAMAGVEAKSQELQGMSAVGVDIESVKNQLEEHKISEVQAAGKRLKEACSAKDGPAVTQQLDQLSAAWAKLNSDTLNRKHQLEDALLQLGQFHDALAQLLSWIADSTGKVSEAPPPGIKTEAVEMQLNELKSLDSAIASHESTVTSLNEAAQKLMSSNTAENTAAETEQDIASLNEKWDHLKALAAERRSSLDTALERAQRFHDNWKRESDWLTEAERRAYADWTPCGLPETCDEEIREHEVFMGEVQSHEEGLEALRGEGEELKGQGTPDDQKRVDLWVEDLAQRLDELGGAIDDRQVQLQQAREKAGEFDNSYRSLAARLEEKEATLRAQEPIHSEVEVVKRQLEENKEFLKGVAELEGQLDTLEGLGLLLAGGCMPDDKEVILQRTSDMRAMWDGLNSAAMERQSSLEESLLSLGEFEDAYSELWAWLTDALRQLGETEPITGDPDMVAAQLARHKALQKQLGARMSSRNAVTKAAKSPHEAEDRRRSSSPEEEVAGPGERVGEGLSDVCGQTEQTRGRLPGNWPVQVPISYFSSLLYFYYKVKCEIL
ncbi:Dystonin, partial [Geodia barretti]